MADELEICAAALFRSKGKDAMTPKELKMYVALDLKWMSMKEADALISVLTESKAVVQANGLLKPGSDFSTIQVPVAYRPTDAVKHAVAQRIKDGKPSSKPAKQKTQTPQDDGGEKDLFPQFVALSGEYGWANKGKFIAECNAVKRKLGIDISAAAVLVLRDSGADVTELSKKVYENLSVH
jgi:hypothetical protein